LDFSEYDAAVKASFEHNANVVQQIIEKGKAG
jgi:ribosomal protein S17E